MSYTKHLIEHSESQQWLKEDGTLTNDANEALMFDEAAHAIFDMVRVHDLSLEKGFRVTEHEFIDDFVNPNPKEVSERDIYEALKRVGKENLEFRKSLKHPSDDNLRCSKNL